MSLTNPFILADPLAVSIWTSMFDRVQAIIECFAQFRASVE